MTIEMSQFFQVFFDETEELLAEKERLLLAVDVANPDEEDLNAIFRAAHSIKGGASTFGFSDITEVTHVLESLLDKIRKGEMALTSEHVDTFLLSKDVLKMLLDGHRSGAFVDQNAVSDIKKKLASLSNQKYQAVVIKEAKQKSFLVPDVDKVHTFRIELPTCTDQDLSALAAELGLLGTIEKKQEKDIGNAFLLSTLESVEKIVSICSFIFDPEDVLIVDETNQIVSELENNPLLPSTQSEAGLGYGFFEPINPPTLAVSEAGLGYGFFAPFVPLNTDEKNNSYLTDTSPANYLEQPIDTTHEQNHHKFEVKAAGIQRETDRSHINQESTSIRVSIEKVDQLINLVGELVITQAMIEQRTDLLDPMAHERLLNSVSQLTRNTRDLQEAVMSIRMMPMDYVFSRFPRMVRDLAGKLGKKVEFITHGAATELDKGLIERIVDPLTHLVRNSIDHGVEMPEVRSAAGKSEVGKLFLSAGHQGGNIVIEVSDDGAGLNRERILAKAKSQGLPVYEDMPDGDVWQLIFAPGFSTAEVVTDVSGRGVGMDVVKRNISSMGGSVDIRSAKGFGTTITISLPLTLAILDGMSIRVGGEIYILPLSFVVESLQPTHADIKEISGQGRVVKVRGEYLPLISLYQMFSIEPIFTDPALGIVVILEADGKKAGLFVDDLVGQQQIVVKNLESNYRKVAGISGATILGDGGVSLILDISALLRANHKLNIDEIS